MNYQDKLRAFADYLDKHPVIAAQVDNRYEHPSLYIYANDWNHFQELCSNVGSFKKSGTAGNLTARHMPENEDGETKYRVSVAISGVCEVKPQVDDEGNPVMRPKMQYVETGEMEQAVEYVCPEVWTR